MLKTLKNIRFSVIIRIFVAVAAIGIIASRQNWSEFYGAISQVNPWIFAAVTTLCVLANCLIAVRWYLLLRAQNITIPYFSGLKIHFLGLFYNNILISSFGGDVLRAWYISRHTRLRVEAAFSVLIDRMVGLIAVVVMSLAFWLFFPVGNIENKEPVKSGSHDINGLFLQYKPFIIIMLAIGLFTVALVVVTPKLRAGLLRIFTKLVSAKDRIFSALRLYLNHPVLLFCTLIITWIAQAMSIIGFWFIGRSMGIPVPFKYYFVIFPISWAVGALPISPGGLGVVELGLVGMFTLAGASSEQAAVLALSQRMIILFGSLGGAVVHIIGAHLPSDTSNGDFTVDSASIKR